MTAGYDLHGFVFEESAPDHLAALKRFAEERGLEWTSPMTQARYAWPLVDAIVTRQEHAYKELEPVFRGIYRRILEHEREEIVESIPWAD